MQMWLCLLLLSSVAGQVLAGDGDQWRLSIQGHHRFVFGDQVLNGYVQIPWQVELDFTLVGEEFAGGSGKVRWFDRVASGSTPARWIACELLEGSYLDSNLRLQEMPRVRFSQFPLAGVLNGGFLRLRPGYSPPGNYLAVRYGCRTANPAASEWFLFAARSRNEEGKRQDAETTVKGDAREARISEVKALPPLDVLSLPLQDGWFFRQGDENADYLAEYLLERR